MLTRKARSVVESPLRPFSSPVDRRRPAFPCPPGAPTVAAIVPARNEQEGIGGSIRSLLDQTRPPDSIFVVVSNSTDDTFSRARRFSGRRVLNRVGGPVTCEVTVIDIGSDGDRRAGALNFAWSLARHHDFVLTVDAGSVLQSHCVRALLDDISADEELGAVSAVPSLVGTPADSGLARILARAQRVEVTAQALRAVARTGSVPLHVGQCALVRASALRDVVARGTRPGPWGHGDGAENVRLGIDLAGAGYRAGVSASARSATAALRTPRAVLAQQAKRIAGIQRRSRDLPTVARLAHRVEWRTGLSGHLVSRLLLAILAAHALGTGSMAGHWWWVVPPLVAVLVNLRIVAGMPDRTAADVLYALLFVPHELYRTVLSLFHVVTLAHERRGCVRDHGADQAAAECGQHVRVIRIRPSALITAGCAAGVALPAWLALPAALREGAIAGAWVLFVLLVAGQSVTGLRMLAGRRRLPIPALPAPLRSVPR
jgi:biofilm PGA synthesis N-glycosyltransferase PgaC